jgi:acetoin utilization protein AcuB
MLVRERMTVNPVTTTPDTTVPDALRLMRERKIRRLPVLDSQGQLIGIVSDKDLLLASPSPATTLAVWEIPEILAKITVGKVMSRNVVTVADDTPLEEAACVMADRQIGGLPVMHGEKMVGIITETDLFKTLLQLFGGRRPGVRLTVAASGAKGTLAKITSAVYSAGGDIVGLGFMEIMDPAGMQWHVMLKVQDVPKDRLVEAVRPLVIEILDARETS